MMGELSNQAARQRTQDIKDVIATPDCSFMQIVEEQTANWSRTQGADLMTNWITAGLEFDADAGWDDARAKQWALTRLGVPACGRATVLPLHQERAAPAPVPRLLRVAGAPAGADPRHAAGRAAAEDGDDQAHADSRCAGSAFEKSR